MRNKQITTYIVSFHDGRQRIVRAHDEASSDRINTALLELNDRDAILDYEQVDADIAGDFAGLTNRHHEQVGIELARSLGLAPEHAGNVAAALDEAFGA